MVSKMKRSFKYRLYPNSKQIEVLEKNLNFCSLLYNNALEERISFFKRFGKSRSYGAQSAQLPEIKAFFEKETENLYAQTIQQVLKKLDRSFANFFRRIKSKSDKVGLPRFKSKHRFNSLGSPQCNMET